MAQPVLRVGVIGGGGIAQMMHLPTVAERPDLFDLVGIADVNQEVLDGANRRFPARVLTTNYRELLGRDDIDAVLLLASGSHKEQVIASLEAGKHVFCEKPVGFSLQEAEAVAAVATRATPTLMVGYHKRFDPAYRRARELVQSLEDLRYVEVTVLHPDDGAYRLHHALFPNPDGRKTLPPEAVSNQGVIDAATRGPLVGCVDQMVGTDAPLDRRVGAFLLFQSLIHDVNALRGVLGEPEEVVSAHVWREGFAQSSLTRFRNDVRVQMSWISLPALRNYEETLLFVGPKGRVKLVFPSPYLRHAATPLLVERMDGEDLVQEVRTVSYEEAFRAELHHFRECVLTHQTPHTTVQDALGDARWIHAIAAAYGGKSQPVPRS